MGTEQRYPAMSAKGCVTPNDCGWHGHWWEELPFRRFLLVLFAFLFIVLFVILVIFLTLYLQKTRFYLQNATVNELNVSDRFLTSSLHFTMVSRNPNARIGILYDRLSSYVSYLSQQIRVGARSLLGPQEYERLCSHSIREFRSLGSRRL